MVVPIYARKVIEEAIWDAKLKLANHESPREIYVVLTRHLRRLVCASKYYVVKWDDEPEKLDDERKGILNGDWFDEMGFSPPSASGFEEPNPPPDLNKFNFEEAMDRIRRNKEEED
jgi:hypothetical protein